MEEGYRPGGEADQRPGSGVRKSIVDYSGADAGDEHDTTLERLQVSLMVLGCKVGEGITQKTGDYLQSCEMGASFHEIGFPAFKAHILNKLNLKANGEQAAYAAQGSGQAA